MYSWWAPPRTQITSWTTQAVHLNVCVCWSSGINELTGQINSMFQLSCLPRGQVQHEGCNIFLRTKFVPPRTGSRISHSSLRICGKSIAIFCEESFSKMFQLPISCPPPAHISLTNRTVKKNLSRWCVEEKLQELWGVLRLFMQKSEISTWAWKRDPHSFWHHFLFSVQTNISFHEGLTHHLFLVSLVFHLPCHRHVHAFGDVRAKRELLDLREALYSPDKSGDSDQNSWLLHGRLLLVQPETERVMFTS